MVSVNLSVFLLLFSIIGLHCAAIQKKDVIEIDQQGLYNKRDKVVILADRNFEPLLYGQKHAWVIQFYNSFCGHCRAFSSKFKEFATDVENWKKVVRIGVVDCSVEENIEICRQFEVMQYPSLRYIHENYTKGNTNIGEKLEISQVAETVTDHLVSKLIDEQSKGRLKQAPSLNIATYSSLPAAVKDVPINVKYTFMIFETPQSTVGAKLLLDTSDYADVAVKRVETMSPLLGEQDVTRFPGLVAVRNDLQSTPLTPKNPSRISLLNAINVFLQSKNMALPSRETSEDFYDLDENKMNIDSKSDVAYLADLESTLKASLHTEITRYKKVRGAARQALLNYLSVLIDYFPFRANGKEFLQELRGRIQAREEWSGGELESLVRELEKSHAPVYASSLEYVSCKGSETRYRGYTCGLWTMFHTLTVGAALAPAGDGPAVLRAMHGYVKHFFGCSECQKHFQEMAERNKIFEVRQNEQAVLWLWIAHNEVNLRLAGDATEDPAHPKVQFPRTERCPDCRLASGAWQLPSVYRYLRALYSPDAVRSGGPARRSDIATLPMGLSTLLYILLLLLLLLVCKVFVAGARRLIGSRAYRRRALGLYGKKAYSSLK